MAEARNLRVEIVAEVRPTISETIFWWLPGEIPHRLREAICEWSRKHGLDPNRMPAHEPIFRDLERCQVRCTYFVLGEDGGRVLDRDHEGPTWQLLTESHVAQGETPPMPWPDVVLDLMDADRSVRAHGRPPMEGE